MKTLRNMLLLLMRITLLSEVLVIVALVRLSPFLQQNNIHTATNAILITALLTVIIIISVHFVEYKGYKGLRYALRYRDIKRRFQRELFDAGIYFERAGFVFFPRITLSLSDDLSHGEIWLEDSIKYHNKMDNLNISSALGRYVTDSVYIDKAQNGYVFYIEDSRQFQKHEFHSFEEYERFCSEVAPRKLIIDKRKSVNVQSVLMSGMTNSGKSYALFHFLLMMLLKPYSCEFYIADAKIQGLYTVGKAIAPTRTAATLEEIVALVHSFVESMELRKKKMAELLSDKLDASYYDFQETQDVSILIIDEYASVAELIKTADKKIRDQFNADITQIVLQGRALGYFLWITMQQASSNQISTLIRENIPLKAVLGNSEAQTYVTCFGNCEIPPHNYQQGEGLIQEPFVSPKPSHCAFPLLDFDIRSAIERAYKGTD